MVLLLAALSPYSDKERKTSSVRFPIVPPPFLSAIPVRGRLSHVRNGANTAAAPHGLSRSIAAARKHHGRFAANEHSYLLVLEPTRFRLGEGDDARWSLLREVEPLDERITGNPCRY